MASYYDRPTLLHIQRLKGHDGSQNYDDTREKWHDAVKSGVRAYVSDSYGNKTYLEARLSSSGHKYIETIQITPKPTLFSDCLPIRITSGATDAPEIMPNR
jgi:hypothetical protein